MSIAVRKVPLISCLQRRPSVRGDEASRSCARTPRPARTHRGGPRTRCAFLLGGPPPARPVPTRPSAGRSLAASRPPARRSLRPPTGRRAGVAGSRRASARRAPSTRRLCVDWTLSQVTACVPRSAVLLHKQPLVEAPMTTIHHQIEAACPPERVWAVLADLEAVQHYNPTVRIAAVKGTRRTGLGAERICELSPKGRVVE